jgi:hypothetical protein
MEPTNHIEEHAKHIRLSAEAKSRIREKLARYMSEHPVMPASPYQRFFILSPYLANLRKPVAAAFALVLIVGIGGATTFAAEGALPGSPLYLLKTHVVEPARVLLATTPEAKAEVKVSIALARVHEAEQLAVEDKLSLQQGREAQATFDRSLTDAKSTLAELALTNKDTADSLQESLAISLDAHEDVLDTLSGATQATSSASAKAFAVYVKRKTEDTVTPASTTALAMDTEEAVKGVPVRAILMMSARAPEALTATSSSTTEETQQRKNRSKDERKHAVEKERDTILRSLGL